MHLMNNNINNGYLFTEKSVNYVKSGEVSYSRLLSQLKLVKFNVTSEYDYCSLCAVCASIYKLCESELNLGCFV